MKIKTLHIIPSVARQSGGPARSSQGLVATLNVAGCESWLLSATPGESAWVPGVNHFSAPDPDEKLEAFYSRMIDAVKPDIIHLHCLWQWQLHVAARVARDRSIPYVIAPRGMLEPWSLKQKWLKKRVARFLYQDKDLKSVAALHATAESEAEQFRKLGFKNKIIISPNGVNVPECLPCRGGGVDKNGKRALFVSRMHPKKGVLELVDAWKEASMQGWTCELVYTAGSDEERSYEARVKARVKDLGLVDSFDFTGALDDDKKWEAYARADLFVLPTYSENFGIVIAEALWAGVPVITTKGTPWKDLVDSKCGWWIDLPPKGSLVEVLKTAANFSALAQMGVRGHRLVGDKYSWNAVVTPLIRGYSNLLEERL